jgi:uncharacterized membrane protein YraQ (UPF0718 family)
MDATTLIMAGIAAILILIALARSQNLLVAGLQSAFSTLWNNLALLLLGFLIAGLVHVLLSRELISQWLGAQSGWRSVLLGCVAGGLMPGSPYAAFPVVASLYHSGASLGAVVGFVTAWLLWSVTRLPVEIALVGLKPALIRYAITFIVPPIAGWVSHLLSLRA